MKLFKTADIKPKKSEIISKEITNFQKDSSLSIFNACGKFLYNKRIDKIDKKPRIMNYT